MKKIKNKLIMPIMLSCALLLAISTAFWGCMETTAPENSKERNVIVQAFQVNIQNGVKIPLSGVQVSVFDAGSTNVISTQTTNQNGAANFSLLAPLAGRNLSFIANYNNQIQSKNYVLLCKDTLLVFVFDTTVVSNVQCNNLNGSETIVFIDENGSPGLKQNTPKGINKYEKCWSMTNSSTTEPIIVAIPSVPAPFSVQSVYLGSTPVSTNPVVVPPGTTLSICFAVSTVNAGAFRETINLTLSCGNNQGTFVLRLQADVIEPGCECSELETLYRVILPESVPVGSSVERTEVVFTNTLACTVVISRNSFDGNDGWTILSPTFPQTLAPGAMLTIRARFSATHALTNADTLSLNIHPEGTQNNCPYLVIFSGQGCSNTCPYLGFTDYPLRIFNSPIPRDTLSNRKDNRVFVSIINVDPPFVSVASEQYTVFNPDSACSEVTINASIIPQDNYAGYYYKVTPTRITLAPGDSAKINVTFTAPSLQTMQQIIAARGNTGRVSDSAFTIRLRLQSGSCLQEVNIASVVTVFPEISPIINLRAYSQRTPLRLTPENEVYYFGKDARTINHFINGTYGEYPPRVGHIFVDVNDTLASAIPPQAPILKLVDNSIGMKVWRNNVPETDFSNVSSIVTLFAADPGYSTGYSSNPITNLNVGDIIAFKFNAITYSLLYIRRVDNGTESTSSKQSGIEFRAIYPIFIP